MTAYEGFGGITGGRPFNQDDAFEVAVERALGAQLRASQPMREAMWSALANVDWQHDNGDTASYTFRAAGDMIAAISGVGDYLNYYCSGPYATVSAEIREALEAQGWHPNA